MIRLEKIGKTYYEADGGVATLALEDVTLRIHKGEFVAVMGPSGSGKSTLLHLLDFLDRPTHGKYFFNDRDTSTLTDVELARLRNKEMGFVFQAFNLLGRSTVAENVELPLLYSDVPVFKRQELVQRAVRAVGLDEKIHVPTANLSGGQKQRVAIARALVNDPSIIFADEPTGNLDSRSGGQVMEILQDLNEQGRTIILVTHETYTANYAQRRIVLGDGKMTIDEPIDNRNRGNGLIK
ncbi:MAG: ABC transporter ATP-binding protein [Patescibacteria group bacterium]